MPVGTDDGGRVGASKGEEIVVLGEEMMLETWR